MIGFTLERRQENPLFASQGKFWISSGGELLNGWKRILNGEERPFQTSFTTLDLGFISASFSVTKENRSSGKVTSW